MSKLVTMKPHAIGCIFWTVQFVSFCMVASRTLGSDNSCPCLPSNECADNSLLFFNSNEVMILPCESENLIRCCSTVPKSIESARADGSPEDPTKTFLDTYRTDTVAGTTELNVPMDTEGIVEEYVASELQTDLPSLEESTWDVPMNEETTGDFNSIDMYTTENNNVTYTDPPDDPMSVTENIESDTTLIDVNQAPLQHPKTKLHPNFPSSRTIRQKDHKKKKNDQLLTSDVSVLRQDSEEKSNIQDWIEEAKNFESRRTSPKQPDLLLIEDSMKRTENSLRRIDSAVPPVVVNKGYFNRYLRFLSTAKSLSEKISDLSKQKTSLETTLTLDRVSTRATNENASSVSKLDAAQRNDTSIINLSYPEDVEDVKRVVRSHASVPNEEFGEGNASRSSSSNLETLKQTKADHAASVKRFKRPPRILPIRNLRNEEHDSNKFLNSRERARSLFNKSNETRRKQVSILINRNDSNVIKINSTSDTSLIMEETENESNGSDKREKLLIEENVTESIDKENRKVVEEKKNNKDV